jgi:hypothetical protein
MPSGWLWTFAVAGGILVLVGLLAALRKIRFADSVSAVYPDGIELAGGQVGERTTYRVVQWLADPADPRPCPLVVHLPGGDLAGDALGDWDATNAAVELGGPDELEIWPFHDERGRVVGVSVRMVPAGGLFGPRPVEVSIDGKRIPLPLTDEDAVRLLGDPTHRRTLG